MATKMPQMEARGWREQRGLDSSHAFLKVLQTGGQSTMKVLSKVVSAQSHHPYLTEGLLFTWPPLDVCMEEGKEDEP